MGIPKRQTRRSKSIEVVSRKKFLFRKNKIRNRKQPPLSKDFPREVLEGLLPTINVDPKLKPESKSKDLQQPLVDTSRFTLRTTLLGKKDLRFRSKAKLEKTLMTLNGKSKRSVSFASEGRFEKLLNLISSFNRGQLRLAPRLQVHDGPYPAVVGHPSNLWHFRYCIHI